MSDETVRVPADVIDRFWALVEKSEECWEWKGYRNKGYGSFWVGPKSPQISHRFSYELHKGPVPHGLTIDHLCRNRACVNPDHLEAVTQAENNRRSPYNIGVINGLKTECANGHPFDAANTYIRPYNGSRSCRECRREARRRSDRKRRAKNG